MKARAALTAALAVALAAGASAATPKQTLTVITHDSFDLDKKPVAAFEARNNATIKFIKGGDAGQMLNRLVLTKGAPIADAVYGLDNTLLAKALANNILDPYESPTLAKVPAAYRIDRTHHLTPVDYGYVALNYDKAWFSKNNLALPKSLADLTKPEYKGLLVVENPATSSPGLAFLYTTVKTFGENGYLDFWQKLRDNDVLVSNGWEDAYYTQFTRAGGSRPIVVSYASSPAAEVFYSKTKLTESPTANLLVPGSAFLQVEGVGVLHGSKQPALARKFVDFMLSPEVQNDFPTRMWVYPVLSGAKLDPVFKHAQVPTQAESATLAPETIGAKGASFVDAWTKVVLQGGTTRK